MFGDFNSDGSIFVCYAGRKRRELVVINTTSLETIILISVTIFLELRFLPKSNVVLCKQGTLGHVRYGNIVLLLGTGETLVS
jgi:hypothetical protein